MSCYLWVIRVYLPYHELKQTFGKNLNEAGGGLEKKN